MSSSGHVDLRRNLTSGCVDRTGHMDRQWAHKARYAPQMKAGAVTSCNIELQTVTSELQGLGCGKDAKPQPKRMLLQAQVLHMASAELDAPVKLLTFQMRSHAGRNCTLNFHICCLPV